MCVCGMVGPGLAGLGRKEVPRWLSGGVRGSAREGDVGLHSWLTGTVFPSPSHFRGSYLPPGQESLLRPLGWPSRGTGPAQGQGSVTRLHMTDFSCSPPLAHSALTTLASLLLSLEGTRQTLTPGSLLLLCLLPGTLPPDAHTPAELQPSQTHSLSLSLLFPRNICPS